MLMSKSNPTALQITLSRFLLVLGLPGIARRFDSRVNTSEASEAEAHSFVLRVVQPGLAGLMDGSVSTLAPIFATAFVTGSPFKTFLVGMASATGAGISMAFAEALSDDGSLTGRGSPIIRGTITGVMTFLGGALHTIPFLLSNIHTALVAAYVVVAVELILIRLRRRDHFWQCLILALAQGTANQQKLEHADAFPIAGYCRVCYDIRDNCIAGPANNRAYSSRRVEGLAL
jgi:erythrin-vacuolar iron transport family protein